MKLKCNSVALDKFDANKMLWAMKYSLEVVNQVNMTLWPDFFFFFNWDHLNYDPGKEFLYNLQFWAATLRVLWVNYYKKSLFLFVAILSSLAIVRRSLRSWVGWNTCRWGPIYKRHRWWMITHIDVLGSILKMNNIMLGFSSHEMFELWQIYFDLWKSL